MARYELTDARRKSGEIRCQFIIHGGNPGEIRGEIRCQFIIQAEIRAG